MAQAEQTDRSVNLAQAILIALVIIGVVVSIILGLLTLIKNKNDELNATFDATELAELEPFNNGTVKGSDIISLISRKQASNFGVVVITAKEKDWVNGLNYLRPLGPSIAAAAPGYAADAAGVYENKLNALDKGAWESAQSIQAMFAYDDASAASVNLKHAKKSGNKHQIIETAKFDCKLVIDSRKPIGTVCAQKGTAVNP